MARVASNEDPDQLLRYIDARAHAADEYEADAQTQQELEAQAREARLTRLLVAMVALIIIGGFIIGVAGLFLFGTGAQ